MLGAAERQQHGYKCLSRHEHLIVLVERRAIFQLLYALA